MNSSDEIDHLLAEIEKELAAIDVRRSELLTQIAKLRQEKRELLGMPETRASPDNLPKVTNQSTQEEKFALFRTL